MEPNSSSDVSDVACLPISSPEAKAGSPAPSLTSDSGASGDSKSCGISIISTATVDEDYLLGSDGSDLEMDLGDLNLNEFIFSVDCSYDPHAPVLSSKLLPAAPSDNIPLEADISFELVGGIPSENMDLADVRLINLSIVEQLEQVSLAGIDTQEPNSVEPVTRTTLDLDLTELIDAAFALEPEELVFNSFITSPNRDHAKIEEPGTPLVPVSEVGLPSEDRTGLKINERSNENTVDPEIGPGTSSDTGSDHGVYTTYQLWTSWFPLASLAMLIGGPVLCLALFFAWRCLAALLESEPACSASRDDAPLMDRDLETNAPAPGVIANASVSLPIVNMSHTIGARSHLQLPSNEENRTGAVVKQKANVIKTPRSKPAHPKKKRADIHPIVATRKAPPRPYRGPPVPITIITPPDDEAAAPQVFYYGPKVVPTSWNGPSDAHAPVPSGRRKRSNAVGEDSRAQVEALVAALPVPAPFPELVPASSSARHPAMTRARGAGRGHRRKQSSMSEWFEYLAEGNNSSIAIPSTELAKLAFVLNSPPSSPELTPPTTPTISSFTPHPEFDEVKSHPTVVAEVSHDGDTLIVY
ncbi:hypothetical protein FRC07_004801 [Ceratobasidium sp. 392]|nr:hypothetical protein FRC07_004801 [Ceratobasidium sp. 392]